MDRRRATPLWFRGMTESASLRAPALEGDDALTRLPATEVARRVRAGELDPVDLTEATLRRIEALEPRLHAFVAVMAESARREAVALRSRGDLESLPLAGVPVAVKDNVEIAGEPTLHGSRATPRTPAAADALIVERLRKAGAVVVGRTALPELAIWPFTEPEAFETARNPWNTERTTGGSSGGSAAAVAARMAAIAVASDGGGSIRIPAACCGLVGVKPAPGVVPLPGPRPEHWYGLSAFGALARTVADAALGVDVMAGTTAYRDPAPPARALRIAVSTKHPAAGAPVAREVRDSVDSVAKVLAGAGHTVERADPRYPMLPLEFLVRWLGGIAQDAEGLDVAQLEKRTQAMVKMGRRVQGRARSASDSRFAAYIREWLSKWDLLITPVLAKPPVAIGRWRGKGWVPTTLGISRWMGYTPPWNLAGVAGVAVPVAQSAGGMPLAVQLLAPAGSEPLLLSVAAQLEQNRPLPQPPI